MYVWETVEPVLPNVVPSLKSQMNESLFFALATKIVLTLSQPAEFPATHENCLVEKKIINIPIKMLQRITHIKKQVYNIKAILPL